MKTTFNKKKAFTLIELLIVIAIIGILFIVLVSKVDFATDKAKATGVQTDFRSFQMAFETVSKENAGFASLGWDTGDANGNHKRDSYDEGDANTNNIMESTEIWTGHKVYGENWTGTYILVNPDDNTDKSAFELLEDKVNANLDPKLHITITPEENAGVLTGNATVTMANGAQDPWNTEYHGAYITNAQNDKGDRGAFIIYSNGANGQWGSEHDIANGKVSIIVPNNNVYGKDDYAMSVFYTYANGYGEVKNITTGFSNNQQFLTGNDEDVNNDESDDNVVTPQEPEHSTGLEYELNEDDVSYSVIGIGTCTDTDIVIPDTHEGLPVTSIGSSAFYESSELTSVEIPNSVINIGKEAFFYCYNLTSVMMGTGVTSIGECAFGSCLALTSVTIPNSVTNIGKEAFYYCGNLTNITIGDNVTNIGVNAFYGTGYYDNESNWENGILYIEQYLIKAKYDIISGEYKTKSGTKGIANFAFFDCENLTSIIISDDVTNIGSDVFRNCSSLTSIIIPDSVTSIGSNVFYDCVSLTSVVIPDSVTSIGDSPFARCSSLTSVTISNGITSIGDYMFFGCNNLMSVTIPNSITNIGSNAFMYCRSLTSVTIPSSVTNIASDAFWDCSGLADIYINKPENSISGAPWAAKNATVHWNSTGPTT